MGWLLVIPLALMLGMVVYIYYDGHVDVYKNWKRDADRHERDAQHMIATAKHAPTRELKIMYVDISRERGETARYCRKCASVAKNKVPKFLHKHFKI